MDEYRMKTLELLDGNTELEEYTWTFWNNTKNPDLIDPIRNYKLVMTTIINAVNEKTFDITKFSDISNTYDFNKARWEHYSDSRPSQIVKIPQAITDMFQCGRCKQWKTTYHTAQIRSGDEGETIFIQCQNCGLHFRM